MAFLGSLVLAGCGTTVPAGQIAAGAQANGSTLGDGSGTSGAQTSTQLPGQQPQAFAQQQGGPVQPGDVNGGSSTTGGTSGAVTPDRSAAASSGPLANRPGVTATTIKIGVITEQGFQGLAKAAGASVATGNMRNQASAVIANLNAHGGIAGRKVVPLFFDVSVSGNKATQEQAACTAFTQDDKVYAVVSPVGFGDTTFYTCLTKAGVVVSDAGESFDAQFYGQYPDFYMPSDMNMTRVMSTNIDALAAAGYFTGWNTNTGKAGNLPVKIGLYRNDNTSEARVRDQGVKPALARHGLTLADEAVRTESDTTDSGASSVVLRFKAEGITHILVTGAGPALVMVQAQSQGYHPRWGLNSRSSPAALLEGLEAPSQLAGSMGIGWQQYNDVSSQKDPGPPSARGKQCLQLMTQAGEDMSSRSTALIATWYCDTIFFLHDALVQSTDLTPRGFRTGAEKLTSFQTSGTFRGSFAPRQTHDGAHGYRLFGYDTTCSCYGYTSPLRTTP